MRLNLTSIIIIVLLHFTPKWYGSIYRGAIIEEIIAYTRDQITPDGVPTGPCQDNGSNLQMISILNTPWSPQNRSLLKLHSHDSDDKQLSMAFSKAQWPGAQIDKMASKDLDDCDEVVLRAIMDHDGICSFPCVCVRVRSHKIQRSSFQCCIYKLYKYRWNLAFIFINLSPSK